MFQYPDSIMSGYQGIWTWFNNRTLNIWIFTIKYLVLLDNRSPVIGIRLNIVWYLMNCDSKLLCVYSNGHWSSLWWYVIITILTIFRCGYSVFCILLILFYLIKFIHHLVSVRKTNSKWNTRIISIFCVTKNSILWVLYMDSHNESTLVT